MAQPRTPSEIINFYLEDYHPGTGIKRAAFMNKEKIIHLCKSFISNKQRTTKNTESAEVLLDYVQHLDRDKIINMIKSNPVAYKVRVI